MKIYTEEEIIEAKVDFESIKKLSREDDDLRIQGEAIVYLTDNKEYKINFIYKQLFNEVILEEKEYPFSAFAIVIIKEWIQGDIESHYIDIEETIKKEEISLKEAVEDSKLELIKKKIKQRKEELKNISFKENLEETDKEKCDIPENDLKAFKDKWDLPGFCESKKEVPVEEESTAESRLKKELKKRKQKVIATYNRIKKFAGDPVHETCCRCNEEKELVEEWIKEN